MPNLVVVALVVGWLLLVVLATVGCAAVIRGGLVEERARGRVPELF